MCVPLIGPAIAQRKSLSTIPEVDVSPLVPLTSCDDYRRWRQFQQHGFSLPGIRFLMKSLNIGEAWTPIYTWGNIDNDVQP